MDVKSKGRSGRDEVEGAEEVEVREGVRLSDKRGKDVGVYTASLIEGAVFLLLQQDDIGLASGSGKPGMADLVFPLQQEDTGAAWDTGKRATLCCAATLDDRPGLPLLLQQEDTGAVWISGSDKAAIECCAGPLDDGLLLQQDDTGLASASETAGRFTSRGLLSGCFRFDPTAVLVLGVAWALDPQTQEPPLRHEHMNARWMVALWMARRAAEHNQHVTR